MADPVGQGEAKHPKGGNALLTTLSKDGKRINTPLWMNMFATDLNLQIDSAQLRDGLSHRPIRFSERFLVFATLWNVKDRQLYVDLIRKIRDHWVFTLNQGIPTPMKLRYYGADKLWLGFIEGANIGYQVTDVILTYQFQMRIVPTETTKWSEVSGGKAPFVPTASDAKRWGPDWYTQNQFFEENIGTGNEKGGSHVPGKAKKNPPHPWEGHGRKT